MNVTVSGMRCSVREMPVKEWMRSGAMHASGGEENEYFLYTKCIRFVFTVARFFYEKRANVSFDLQDKAIVRGTDEERRGTEMNFCKNKNAHRKKYIIV